MKPGPAQRPGTGRILVLLLGLALVAGACLLLAANLEWGERKVWVGWQGEARSNPYLAAKRFLDGADRATDCFNSLPLAELNAEERGLLLLPARSLRLSPGQVAALVAFVENGGVLLAEGAWIEDAESSATQDPLFAAFGARMVASTWWERLKDRPMEEVRAFQQAHRTLPVQLHGAPSPPLQVRFNQDRRLEDRGGRAQTAFGDDAGLKALRVARGTGCAVLFTDMEWLQNEAIGEHDHAAFLEALAGLADPGRARTALVVREAPPSLRAWLLERAPATLGLLAVFIALALWRAAPRFGPVLPDPPEARRSLLEHLQACGRFQWRLQEGRALLQSARQATLDHLVRVHPGWAALAPDALCRRIAEHTGLPEPRVFRALRYERVADPHGFTEALQTLDLIRKTP